MEQDRWEADPMDGDVGRAAAGKAADRDAAEEWVEGWAAETVLAREAPTIPA
jgi:hypothetical protein